MLNRIALVRPAAGITRREVALIVYLGAVVGGTSAALVVAVIDPAGIATGVAWNWPLLLALTGAAAVLERMGTDLFGDSKVSLSFVPLFAVAILLGPAAGGAAAAAAIILAHGLDPTPWYKRLFNIAVVAVAGITGATLFYVLAGEPTSERAVGQLFPAAAAAQFTFLTNSLLVAGVIAISARRRPLEVWREKFLWLAPHYIALGLAAYAMALAYLNLGWPGIAIFTFPVAMLWFALKQYADRARADVRRLQEANTALTKSEQRFRALVQNAPGFVAVLDADAALQYMSQMPFADEHRWRPKTTTSDFASLVHPEDAPRVRGVIADVVANPARDGVVEFKLRHHDGDGGWRHYAAVVKNLIEDTSVGGIVINAHDITEQKTLEGELRHQALHDPLTRLPNRALFMDRLEHALETAGRTGRTIAVMFLDLDRFKVLNDSLGHNAGDGLLVAISERLSAATPPGDTVARFGGDEFTVLLEDVESAEDAIDVANQLMAEINAPVELQGHRAVVSASVGIALSGGEGVLPRDLIRRADVALFRAKAEGRGRHVLFDEKLDAHASERFELEIELRQAVRRNELRLYYQPEIDLRTNRVVGFEALVRWEHPTRGMIAPDDFIPLAEETGEIVAIGHWVLSEACRQAQRWQRTLFGSEPFTMSVNLSAREFLEPDLVWRIATTLRDTGLPAGALRIEITESALLRDTAQTRNVFLDLQGLGVQLAIDDFGTGYSSLNYLRRLPADVLKIDRSFVADVDRDPREVSIVRAVVNVGEALGMIVTAEGIERQEQLDLLASIGCTTAQGYYFSPPREAAVIEEFVRRNEGRTAA